MASWRKARSPIMARTGSPDAIHNPIPVAIVPSIPARPRFATACGAALPGRARRSRRRTVMEEPTSRVGAPGRRLASHTVFTAASAATSALPGRSGSGRASTARRQESAQTASARSSPRVVARRTAQEEAWPADEGPGTSMGMTRWALPETSVHRARSLRTVISRSPLPRRAVTDRLRLGWPTTMRWSARPASSRPGPVARSSA